jgi:hypothetical protein
MSAVGTEFTHRRRDRVQHLRIIAVLLVLAATPAQANTFAPQDAQPFTALVRRLLDAQRDNLTGVQALNAQHSLDDVQCLNDVNSEVVSLHFIVSEISDLLYLSTQMQNIVDEMTVNRLLSEQIRLGLAILPNTKKSINLHAAYCARNAFVSSRAQGALFLLDEAERLMRSISRRL